VLKNFRECVDAGRALRYSRDAPTRSCQRWECVLLRRPIDVHLVSIWRDFCHQQRARGLKNPQLSKNQFHISSVHADVKRSNFLLSVLVMALPEFQFLLDFAKRTRGGIALSVLQHDQVLALEHRLKLLDLVNVDDHRAADAQELLRGQMGLQRTHGLAQDMILLAGMHDSVFSCGLDGLDLVQLHKANLARGLTANRVS
jgi:hypothetical protein